MIKSNIEQMKDEIRVFTHDDKSLKLLGELLSNDTSRRIIRCLIEKQMYTNELATKLDIPISLVIHHLKKLEELGLVDVEEKQITRKTKDHKFFRMTGKFFILPNDSQYEVTKTGMLKQIFREKIRYTLVGSTALSVFVLAGTRDGQMSFIEESAKTPFYQESIFVPLLIIIGGLILEIIIKKKSEKRINSRT